MSKISLWVGAVTTALLLSACNPETPKIAFKHSERRGKLESNGMRFVLMPDETTQLVEVDVRYDVGSREDPIGKAGIAHLVEHLMFQQRPDGPTSPPLFQSLADISTYFNAYTNWDSTHYQTGARMENLDALLKIDAMRMYYGCKTISQDQFEREREVVRNEIRLREGDAEGQIPQLVMSSIYPKGHAYERMIGGDDQQLATITLDEACDFMKKYYAPERATVIIAGAFKVDDTVKSIEKWFGKIEKRTPAPRVPVASFEVDRQKKQVDLDIERPVVTVAWALPASNTPEGEAANFGVWSAFFRTASKAQEYDFAYSVTPEFLGGQLAPVFLISIELKGMNKLDEALDFVWKGAKQAYRGFDQGSWAEIEEQKNLNKAQFIQGMEQLSARTNTMGDLVQFSKEVDFDSQELYIFHELDKIGKFDGARVASAVKKYIDPDKARVVVFKPNKEGIKGDTRSKIKFATKSDEQMQSSEVDPTEAKRPIKVGAELKGLDGAQRFKLGNGMNVVMLPIKSMPLVEARLIFDNIGSAVTPDNPALATASANFLNLPMDAEAFAKTGVSVNCGADDDATICESRGMSIYLDVILKGLDRLITAGEYSQTGIENWQKRLRERFKTKATQQRAEFQRQILTALYGPDHAYTKSGVITPEAAAKVHRDSLNDFRHSHYTAGNATLIIVGDFDPKSAETLVRDNFGGWATGGVVKPIDPAPYKRNGPAYVGVVGKEAPQMYVAIAYPAPGGIDGQEGARQVLAEMINIRVGDVRFKLGSSYGIYGGRRHSKGPGAYQIQGPIDSERVGESIKVIRDGLNMLRTAEHFDEDFVRARRKIMTELLGMSTVTSELAQRLGTIAEYGLLPSYYNTLLQQVAAVSPAQVKALIKRELDPNIETIVVLGDRPHLDKAFADAGIKDVKIVEAEYK